MHAIARSLRLGVVFSVVASALTEQFASAQVGAQRVTVPSPAAASLGKFGDIPVSLYTGVPDITIPLATAKGRTLELPIALKYHAGGNRVQEIGSWVGLGWALEAGGTITRTVHGLPDDLANGYYFTGNQLWIGTNWSNPSQTFLQSMAQENVDGEPDQFFFSLGGGSGEFVIGPTSSSTSIKEYRTIPYRKLKIDLTMTGGGISVFVITTEDGTRYTFGAADYSSDYTFGSGNVDMGSHTGQQYPSAWHLTEVRSPGGDVITLSYTTYTARHRLPGMMEDHHQVSGSCPAEGGATTLDNSIFTQRLTSIISAANTITFTPASALRQDALGLGETAQEPMLDVVTVATPTGTVLRSFKLDHDYSATGRLRLTRVSERDRNGVSLPPYVFEYNPMGLPDRWSNAIDHWGFYNGRTWNANSLPSAMHAGYFLPGANRDVDPGYAQAEMLTKITYPTGGYNEFVYESNDYGAIGQSGEMPIVEVAQSASVGAWHGNDDPTQSFTIGGSTPVPVTVSAEQGGADCEINDCPYTEIVGVNRWYAPSTYETVTLSPGTYTLHASTNGTFSGWSSISIEWKDQVLGKKKLGGGVRIAELRTADALGNVEITKYRYTLAVDSTRSSGIVNAEPLYTYDVSSTVNSCSYIARASVSTAPLGSGPPVGYREVLVLHGANGEFGKTRHKFRSVLDAADAQSTNSWPFSRPTSAEWLRGQQIESTEYDNAGRAQQRTASVYNFDAIGAEVSRRFRGMSAHVVSVGYSLWDIRFSEYEVVSGWAYQSSDTSVVFDTTGTSSFSTARSFTYGNPLHLQTTEIAETNSDGTQGVTRMRYPADYATGFGNAEAAALTQMQGAANMHSPVIERWIIKRAGGIDSVVQAELTSFKEFGTGVYLPYQRFAFNSPNAVTNFTASSVSGGVFTKDTRYLLQETDSTYDGGGRIIKLTDARNNATAYQYGGNANNAFLTKVTRICSGCADLVTDLAYDSDGYLQSIKDEGNSFKYFTYDLFGRLREVKNHAGEVVKAYGYTYSRTSPSWTFNSASPNAVIDTTFLQQTPTQKSVVSTQYLDGLGRPIQTVVQDGASYVVTANDYDAMGRPWRSWKPYTRATAGFDGSVASNATSFYNSYLGQSQAKPYVETQYRPDALGRVSRVIPEYVGAAPSFSMLQSYGLDAGLKQSITEITDEAGKKTRRFTDVFGSEVKTILGYGAPEATTTQLESDILGNRIKVTDPRSLITTYAIDTRGLLASRTSPDAGTVNQKYDAAGNIRYSQDANQAALGQVYFTTYDFANRPAISGLGSATFSALDPNAGSPPALETTQSNWLTVREYGAKPSTASFPWSLFSTEVSPLALANVTGRLAAVANKSNGAWQVSLFSYDAEGRVATRYTYTQDNSASSVLSAVNTTVTYARDLRDALTQRSLVVGASTFNHWYDYDGRGLLWKVYASTSSTKPASADATYTYRPSGQVQDRQFLGGPLVPMQYSIREQLASIGDPASTAWPFSARYGYNPNGTVSDAEFYNVGSPAAEKRYKYIFPSYDALNRLKSADFSSWNGSAWTSTLAYDLAGINYDASGNITALQRYRENATLIDNLTYVYPTSSNRLNSVSDAVGGTGESWDAESGAFTYDSNGNVTAAPAPYGITAVAYDHHNLPVSLTSNGTTSAYRYDGTGQRIAKRVASGNIEMYVLDGSTTLAVVTLNGSGNPVSWYFNLLAGDQVAGREPSGGTRTYYHSDLLGSTRAAVQGSGAVESFDFEPFGLAMPARSLGGATKEGFTGKEQDVESGLDYFGARYYMAAFARWAATDPLAEKHPEWSPYNYVLDDPNSLTDPDGQQVKRNGPTPFTRGPMRPGVFLGAVAQGALVAGNTAAGFVPGLSTVQDATAVVAGVDFTGTKVGAHGRILALAGLLTPASGRELRAAETIAEEGIGAARTAVRLGEDAAQAGTLGERAREIHSVVGARTQRATTIAVTETEEGVRVVSSSERRLRPAQRKALRSGEVEGVGRGHAEETGVNAAEAMGLTPTATGASRPICPRCANFLDKKGVRPATELKKP